MKVLAFDTSTEALSIALTDGARLWEHSGLGGAQASVELIPQVLALLQRAGMQLAALDAIAFGRGPGSFTGLRTACAVAQGLGFGAGVNLLPVDTLLAVAEDARERHGVRQVVAVLDARMGEVYAAAHDLHTFANGMPVAAIVPAQLLKPEEVQVPPGWPMAGNAFAAHGTRLPAGSARLEALPTAAAMLRLAPALLAAGHAVAPEAALPSYIRDKVAQTTEERLAAKAAGA